LYLGLLPGPGADLGLIFSNEEGRPMNYSNMMNRHFFPALKKAGIMQELAAGKVEGRIRFHDLRHTYASLLLHQGENVKYIQKQLGHHSPTVTLNVYSHLMSETNQPAAERLENTIFEKKPGKISGKVRQKMGKKAKEELRLVSQPLLN
jgi:integrase